MTNKEAITILDIVFSMVDLNGKALADLVAEAFQMALNALKANEEAEGCRGCAFLTVDEEKDPCRMCRRNCKDYFRRAKKNAD